MQGAGFRFLEVTDLFLVAVSQKLIDEIIGRENVEPGK